MKLTGEILTLVDKSNDVVHESITVHNHLCTHCGCNFSYRLGYVYNPCPTFLGEYVMVESHMYI